MLRQTLTKLPTEKDQIILQTNHNYFVRTAIAAVARILLAGFIAAAVVLAAVLIGVANASSATSLAAASGYMSAAYFIIGLVGLAYLIYVIVKITEISNLYAMSTKIENKILGSVQAPQSNNKLAAKPSLESEESQKISSDEEDI